jgi:Tol biopolymer transport system component
MSLASQKDSIKQETMMKKILMVIMAMLVCFTGCAGCAAMDKKNYDVIREISFSPDGKKILFDRSNGGRPSMIHVYNLETGDLAAYQSSIGETWVHARYSFDGRRIVFIIMPLIENKEDPANTQIAVMDPDGRNVRKVTNTTGFKVYPSFSHSGRKIIFGRADTIRKKGGRTPVADYDLYEVNVETGREIRLTQFKFFRMSKPYYFPDDKTFIFGGEYPRDYPGIPINDKHITVMDKIIEELEAKYKHNSIYVMQGNEKELKPYIEMHYDKISTNQNLIATEYSREPALSADGSILIFEAQGYKSDGSADWNQVFQYSSDGNHRRITYLHATAIWSEAVSPNGDLLAVVYDAYPTRNVNKIVIYQVKDGTSRDITLPDQPSRIINGQ